MRRRTGAAALICLLASVAAATAKETSYDGKFELGLYIPFGKFDSSVPVRDTMGEDDEIRDAFGQGIHVAFNFSPHHAIESKNTWISTDSEDQRGANHFAIRTRFNTLDYRYTHNVTRKFAPFVSLGVGWFRAKALEASHVSRSGSIVETGLGLRFYTSHRSGLFLMVDRTRVNLEPRDAVNVIYSAGITSHFGKGPQTFQPPPTEQSPGDM